MIKATTVGRKPRMANKSDNNTLTSVVTLANKHGWDLEGLGLASRDLFADHQAPLTRKELLERNRRVKKALQRFSKVLTPPVPRDLEKSLSSKEQSSWLPWEREVMQKIGDWRLEAERARPQILNELKEALAAHPPL